MFDVRPFDLSPEGLEDAAALLRLVFPSAKHIGRDYLERLCFGNPLGETFGFSAFDGDQRIAHNLMIPIKARCFGEEEMGIWPFQFATHPETRMKGLFVTLTEMMMDESRKRGFTFLSGVGNQNSTPILVKKWGYQSVCQLDAKVGFGTAPPRGELVDPDLDRIWPSAQAVAWRLGHAQLGPYQVAWRGDRGHVYADSGLHGIKVQIGELPRELLPQDLPALRSANPLRLWVGKDPTRDWSGSLYVDVPRRLRPSPLNLLWLDLTGQGRTHRPDHVRYEVFDFDAY